MYKFLSPSRAEEKEIRPFLETYDRGQTHTLGLRPL